MTVMTVMTVVLPLLHSGLSRLGRLDVLSQDDLPPALVAVEGDLNTIGNEARSPAVS